MKLTPIKEEILRILKTNSKPISTKKIKEEFMLNADLSNVYRNLNSLELSSTINSISIEGTKYYYAFDNLNGHFIICKSCGEMQSFHNCNEQKLQSQLEEQFGYKLLSHKLYFEGYCKICTQNIEN